MAKAYRKVTHKLIQHQKRLYTRSRRSYRTKLLFKALKDGNVAMIKLLLKEGGLLLNARSDEGITLLQVAVYFFQRRMICAIIRRLVRAGCRINAANDLGDTALHIAVRYQKTRVAIQLIELGANVHAKNKLNETPLELAVSIKSIVYLPDGIIPNGDRYRKMNFYGLMNSLYLVITTAKERNWGRDLVSKGKMINSVSHSLVKMLLDAGADVNVKDVNDCSVIQCAVYTGDVKLVKTFIDAGADLNHRNKVIGTTVLHDAVLCCNEAMVNLLLSRGAKVDIETEEKRDTALHWAARLNINNSHEKVIKGLMEFGSDLNHENILGETPFSYILQSCDVNLVSFLVDEHKVDLNNLQYTGPIG